MYLYWCINNYVLHAALELLPGTVSYRTFMHNFQLPAVHVGSFYPNGTDYIYNSVYCEPSSNVGIVCESE